MEYQLSILASFKDKLLEDAYLQRENQKGLKFMGWVVLISSIANLLFGITDIFFLTWSKAVLFLDFFVRVANVIIAIFLFSYVYKKKINKYIGIYFCCFAVMVYASHLLVALHFAPINILYETLAVSLITPCVFLIPNKWVINFTCGLIVLGLYAIAAPHLCAEAANGDRIITIAYLVWNLAVISIVFYRTHIYKRNNYAKELQLEELVKTDYLTKVHNRKACDEMLETKCDHQAAFSFVMFDIDHFKDINDTYGHMVGDAVIVSIITIVRQLIRKNDILARWGGEEFVIVLPYTTLSEAREFAKRIKDQISLIKHQKVKSPITCSFGVTALNTGDTAASITSRADQLLYLAKEYGRNRVVAG